MCSALPSYLEKNHEITRKMRLGMPGMGGWWNSALESHMIADKQSNRIYIKSSLSSSVEGILISLRPVLHLLPIDRTAGHSSKLKIWDRLNWLT